MTQTIAWKLPGGRFETNRADRCHLMVASSVAAEEGKDAFPAACVVARTAAATGRPVLLAELRAGRRRAAGVYSTAVSRAVAELVGARFRQLTPVTRGPVCHLTLPADADEAAGVVGELPEILPQRGLCLVHTSPSGLRSLVEEDRVKVDSALLVADLDRDRSLTALACEDLSRRGIRCRVWKLEVGGLRAKLAALGLRADRPSTQAATRLLAGLGVGLEDPDGS